MLPLVNLDPVQWRMLCRVALAMALGGALGLERQMAHKPAGLRTHMLVAGASALFVVVGDAMVIEMSPAMNRAAEVRGVDPLRILQAIVAGVAFLGAGTIIRRQAQDEVEGLTTAASLLFAAAIGVAASLGLVIAAAGCAALALVVLRLLR